ncbi:hypothetical protein EON62_01365, partial [archaeon]
MARKSPSSATVASATSIAASWYAPSQDAGSDVLQYALEWYAGRPTFEVQTVTVSGSTGLAEVQAVTLTADAPGTVGAFRLRVEGGTNETEDIAHDASAADVAAALHRTGAVGSVTVTRAEAWRRLPGEYALTHGGSSSCLTADAVTAGADFALSAAGLALLAQGAAAPRIRLRSSAEREDVANVNDFAVLTGSMSATGFCLGTLADASVAASPVHAPEFTAYTLFVPANGYTWVLTFARSLRVGDMPQVSAAAGTGLAGAGVALRVETVQHGESAVGGTFALGFGGETSFRVPWNASAELMASALTSMAGISTVDVTRRRNANGFDWAVTFTSHLGDVPMLITNPAVNPAGLTGPSARAVVSETVKGVLPPLYCATTPAGSNTTVLGAARLIPAAAVGERVSAVLDGLTPGVAYTVRVSAANARGWGAAHEVGTGIMPRTTPSAPRVESFITMSDTSAKLVWRYPDNDGGARVLHYKVEWSRAPDFGDVGATNSSMLVTDTHAEAVALWDRVFMINLRALLPGALYWARVSGVNVMGVGAPAHTGSVLMQVLLPGAPRTASVALLSDVELLVTWQPPSEELLVYGGSGGRPLEGYILEWVEGAFTAVSMPVPTVVLLPVNTTAYTVGRRDPMTGNSASPLTPGATYSVRVMSYTAAGASEPAYASPALVTMVAARPSAPLHTTAAAVDASSILATWQVPASDGGATLTGFMVQWDAAPTFDAAPQSMVLPVAHETQVVELSAGTDTEVQLVNVLVDVDNQVQSVTTFVDGVDEVQRVQLVGSTVVNQVQAVDTYAAAQDEVQSVTLTGADVNEVQTIVSFPRTPAQEVQVVRGKETM